jgi:hypothetical protein
MLIGEPLPFITEFVESINDAIREFGKNKRLSSTQRYWISFCIMAIIMTNTVCWATFERAGLGRYALAALSWMLRNSNIPWEFLLCSSVNHILKSFGIDRGTLSLDDSEKKRSKNTKRISNVHKMKDKKTDGYLMGQSIVFLVLITPIVTIPVGFMFYMPDPKLTEWNKLKKQRKISGCCQKKPPKNHAYPTKQEIALILLRRFRVSHPTIRIQCILADNLYCCPAFFEKATEIFGKVQVISQIKSDQNIRYRNGKKSVKDFFSSYSRVSQKISIRGGEEVNVVVGSARLHVCSHKTKLFVIALRYEGEEEYRYLVASDLTWRTEDIVKAYTLRWLIEVFIQDWKSYEGWNTLTKQRGDEGSERTPNLSLLTDHCLLLHPEQRHRMNNKLPAITVGSLIEKSKVECLFVFIRELMSDGDKNKLDELSDTVSKLFRMSPSKKHMVGRDLGNLAPSPSLKYKTA